MCDSDDNSIESLPVRDSTISDILTNNWRDLRENDERNEDS